MKNDVIYLMNVTTEQDADGFPIELVTRVECMADVQSAKRTEHYQASTVGMNVSLVASVNYDDYKEAIIDGKKPSRVLFDDIEYKISRTYRVKKHNSIELTLAEVE